jgi:hypothetical protein
MAGNVTMTVEWLDPMRVGEKLATMPSRVALAAARATYQRAGLVLTEAEKIVPVDIGILKDSGYVEKPVVKATSVYVTIGFGGAAADYALKQHEDMELNHPGGGQAKYLSTPALAAQGDLEKDIAKEVEIEMRKP